MTDISPTLSKLSKNVVNYWIFAVRAAAQALEIPDQLTETPPAPTDHAELTAYKKSTAILTGLLIVSVVQQPASELLW